MVHLQLLLGILLAMLFGIVALAVMQQTNASGRGLSALRLPLRWWFAIPYAHGPGKKLKKAGKQSAANDRLRHLRPVSEGGGDLGFLSQQCKDSFYDEVENRLEQAFELYLRDRITLDTYKEMVSAERYEAQHRFDSLKARQGEGDAWGKKLAESERALEATCWCLDWADKLR